jgi:hypothetical protein
MELLAQCSHVLYNEELLLVMQKNAVLEKEKREKEVPRIKYNSKSEWKHAVNAFTNNIQNFILNEQRQPWIPIDEYITLLKNKYCNELNQLTRDEASPWCQRKSDDLGRLIRLGFRGLDKVKFAGRGSFPLTNWRIKDYRFYILGIVRHFENEYEIHLYAGKHGWLEQIPYYHCVCCDNPIEGLCVMIAMRRYPKINKRCIPCIKKIFYAVTKIQARWRGYKYRL